MKTYLAEFNPDKHEGVFGISLVHDPAMEGKFIALKKDENKQELRFKTIDEEKRILIGLVLEPNKPVYRNQNNEEFNIVFDENIIVELAYNFFKSNYHKNSTIEHENAINGVTFVESWIVEDAKIDKQSNFGLSHPKGSWLATMKIDDDNIWENYVKTGKVLGFSVDAMLELKEIKLKKDSNMQEKVEDFIKEVKTMLGIDKKAEVKLASVKGEDFEIFYEGEELVAGVGVWVENEEKERIPLPAGEYNVEGKVLVVAEEGVLAEIKDMEMNKEPEAPSQEGATQQQELENAIKSILVKYKADNDEVLKEIKAELAGVKRELVELAAQPAAQPTKARPAQVELNSKGRLLEKLRNTKN